MNHFVFCINDNWSIPAGVLIESILYYNKNEKFTFHIITKSLSKKSLTAFNKIQTENPDAIINPLFINDDNFKTLPIRENDHVTIETYFRLLLPDLLDKSISKILYLDCDILCTGKITDLFNTDISDYACAMSPDTCYSNIEVFNRLDYPYENGYFCAGVMLFNLDYWRKNDIGKKCIEYLNTEADKCLWHDQDAINKILNGKIKQIHPKYNILPGFYYILPMNKNIFQKNKLFKVFIKKELWNDIIEAVNSPVLVHFSGTVKPWHKAYYEKPFYNLWRLFFKECKWTKYKLLRNPYGFTGKIKVLVKLILHLAEKRNYSPEIYDVELKLINQKKNSI